MSRWMWAAALMLGGAGGGQAAAQQALQETPQQTLKPVFAVGLPAPEALVMPSLPDEAPTIDAPASAARGYRRAAKIEQISDRSPVEKVAAWRQVAADEALPEATRGWARARADRWAELVEITRARCALVAQVKAQRDAEMEAMVASNYEALRGLKRLSEALASAEAVERRLSERYAPWAPALDTYPLTCSAEVMVDGAAAPGRPEALGIEPVALPGGRFTVGDEGAEITVAPFSISKTEITAGQYAQCVAAGACAPATSATCTGGDPKKADHPINCVDWYEAMTFARWVGGRLPTEAEWAYAARSGGRAVKYPWGDAPPTQAHAIHDGPRGGHFRPEPVCSAPEGHTAQGLCDMAGNVREWTLDTYHPDHAGAPTDGGPWVEQPSGWPARPRAWQADSEVGGRVTRGGSWAASPSRLETRARQRDEADDRYQNIGFRVVF